MSGGHGRGGRLFLQAQVQDILGGPPARVQTRLGPVVTAEAAVVASPSPLDDLLEIHGRVAAFRVHAIGVLVPRGSVAPGGYSDDLGRSVLVEGPWNADQDLLRVEGEAHRVGRGRDPGQHCLRLEGWARRQFPCQEVRFRWSRIFRESPDGLSLIGRNPWDRKNILIAPWGRGPGLADQVVAGAILRDLILGRSSAFSGLYDPMRPMPGQALKFGPEASLPWVYTRWCAEGDVAAGTGGVLRSGEAVLRDLQGTLRPLTAHCPGLDSKVCWQPELRAWSCQCHGFGGVFI